MKDLEKFRLQPPVCSWDWNKMTSAERKGRYVCRCWNECPKLMQEKRDRIDNAQGFWQRLKAKLF